MSTSRQNFGKLGEDLACQYLIKKQYKILAKNWHSRFGEVDIVAQKQEKIVFIEVKTRRSNSRGDGIEAATRYKLKKVLLAGLDFLHRNSLVFSSFCLEIVEIRFEGNKARLRHYKDIQI